MAEPFDICVVAQAGRLSFEAVLFAASLREASPDFAGELVVGEPQSGALWPDDPRMEPEARDILTDLGATILPFESRHFGASYPNGNKVEMLAAMAPDRPFVFFDTDTLILRDITSVPFDFDRPSASMVRENTWPIVPLYGPSLSEIWQAVYERAGVDMSPSLDLEQPEEYWERHLYLNAGWFHYKCPHRFGTMMRDLMVSIRDDPPEELACQSFNPWLDQIALPAVITALGGGRPNEALRRLDGEVSLHWRAMPLFYAKANDAALAYLEQVAAPNRIKKVLKQYEPFKRMIYQGRGARIRAMFDRENLPHREQAIRNQIKRANFWMR